MSLQDLVAKHAEMKKELESSGKSEFFKWFKDFFEKYPFITEVQWCQYTPYFNDGEPCEFRVNSPDFKILKTYAGAAEILDIVSADYYDDEDEEEDEDGNPVESLTNSYGMWSYKTVKKGTTPESVALSNAMIELTVLFEETELFKLALDDHSKITVNKDEITVEEYEHD